MQQDKFAVADLLLNPERVFEAAPAAAEGAGHRGAVRRAIDYGAGGIPAEYTPVSSTHRAGSTLDLHHRLSEQQTVIESLRAQIKWHETTVKMPNAEEAEALLPFDVVGKKVEGGRKRANKEKFGSAELVCFLEGQEAADEAAVTAAADAEAKRAAKAARRAETEAAAAANVDQRDALERAFKACERARANSAEPCACGADSAATCTCRTHHFCPHCRRVQKTACKKQKCQPHLVGAPSEAVIDIDTTITMDDA